MRFVGLWLMMLSGQQSVVLKDLGKKFELLEVIKGGSVMGDGSIGLVLDIEGIFEQAKL